MKATRADWAAVAGSVDFENVRNIPAESPFAAPDMSQIGGKNFGDGQYPRWNSSLRKFIPATLPSSGSTPSGTTVIPWKMITFFWDAPTLLPLQSCYEDFDFVGALPSDPVAVGAPFDIEFCQASAVVTDVNTVRLTVFNGNLSPVDLSDGVWKIARFPTV